MSSYRMKKIEFLGRPTVVLCQNENGPCPLLAICSALLLENQIDIHHDYAEVTLPELISLVANRLVEANSSAADDAAAPDDAAAAAAERNAWWPRSRRAVAVEGGGRWRSRTPAPCLRAAGRTAAVDSAHAIPRAERADVCVACGARGALHTHTFSHHNRPPTNRPPLPPSLTLPLRRAASSGMLGRGAVAAATLGRGRTERQKRLAKVVALAAASAVSVRRPRRERLGGRGRIVPVPGRLEHDRVAGVAERARRGRHRVPLALSGGGGATARDHPEGCGACDGGDSRRAALTRRACADP